MASFLLAPLRKYLTDIIASNLSAFLTGIELEGLGLLGSDLVLNNVELRLDAFQALVPEPIDLQVRRGFVRELRVTIPWTALLSSPIQVRLDTIEVVLGRKSGGADVASAGAGGGKVKSKGVSGAASTASQPVKSPPASTSSSALPEWIKSRVSLILANLSLEVSNLVLRFEHGDAALALTLGSLRIASADPSEAWSTRFMEPLGRFATIFKLLAVKDLSLTCDTRSTSSSGLQTRYVEDPLLSRASVTVRLAIPLSRVPVAGSEGGGALADEEAGAATPPAGEADAASRGFRLKSSSAASAALPSATSLRDPFRDSPFLSSFPVARVDGDQWPLAAAHLLIDHIDISVSARQLLLAHAMLAQPFWQPSLIGTAAAPQLDSPPAQAPAQAPDAGTGSGARSSTAGVGVKSSDKGATNGGGGLMGWLWGGNGGASASEEDGADAARPSASPSQAAPAPSGPTTAQLFVFNASLGSASVVLRQHVPKRDGAAAASKGSAVPGGRDSVASAGPTTASAEGAAHPGARARAGSAGTVSSVGSGSTAVTAKQGAPPATPAPLSRGGAAPGTTSKRTIAVPVHRLGVVEVAIDDDDEEEGGGAVGDEHSEAGGRGRAAAGSLGGAGGGDAASVGRGDGSVSHAGSTVPAPSAGAASTAGARGLRMVPTPLLRLHLGSSNVHLRGGRVSGAVVPGGTKEWGAAMTAAGLAAPSTTVVAGSAPDHAAGAGVVVRRSGSALFGWQAGSSANSATPASPSCYAPAIFDCYAELGSITLQPWSSAEDGEDAAAVAAQRRDIRALLNGQPLAAVLGGLGEGGGGGNGTAAPSPTTATPADPRSGALFASAAVGTYNSSSSGGVFMTPAKPASAANRGHAAASPPSATKEHSGSSPGTLPWVQPSLALGDGRPTPPPPILEVGSGKDAGPTLPPLALSPYAAFSLFPEVDSYLARLAGVADKAADSATDDAGVPAPPFSMRLHAYVVVPDPAVLKAAGAGGAEAGRVVTPVAATAIAGPVSPVTGVKDVTVCFEALVAPVTARLDHSRLRSLHPFLQQLVGPGAVYKPATPETTTCKTGTSSTKDAAASASTSRAPVPAPLPPVAPAAPAPPAPFVRVFACLGLAGLTVSLSGAVTGRGQQSTELTVGAVVLQATQADPDLQPQASHGGLVRRGGGAATARTQGLLTSPASSNSLLASPRRTGLSASTARLSMSALPALDESNSGADSFSLPGPADAADVAEAEAAQLTLLYVQWLAGAAACERGFLGTALEAAGTGGGASYASPSPAQQHQQLHGTVTGASDTNARPPPRRIVAIAVASVEVAWFGHEAPPPSSPAASPGGAPPASFSQSLGGLRDLRVGLDARGDWLQVLVPAKEATPTTAAVSPSLVTSAAAGACLSLQGVHLIPLPAAWKGFSQALTFALFGAGGAHATAGEAAAAAHHLIAPEVAAMLAGGALPPCVNVDALEVHLELRCTRSKGAGLLLQAFSLHTSLGRTVAVPWEQPEVPSTACLSWPSGGGGQQETVAAATDAPDASSLSLSFPTSSQQPRVAAALSLSLSNLQLGGEGRGGEAAPTPSASFCLTTGAAYVNTAALMLCVVKPTIEIVGEMVATFLERLRHAARRVVPTQGEAAAVDVQPTQLPADASKAVIETSFASADTGASSAPVLALPASSTSSSTHHPLRNVLQLLTRGTNASLDVQPWVIEHALSDAGPYARICTPSLAVTCGPAPLSTPHTAVCLSSTLMTARLAACRVWLWEAGGSEPVEVLTSGEVSATVTLELEGEEGPVSPTSAAAAHGFDPSSPTSFATAEGAAAELSARLQLQTSVGASSVRATRAAVAALMRTAASMLPAPAAPAKSQSAKQAATSGMAPSSAPTKPALALEVEATLDLQRSALVLELPLDKDGSSIATVTCAAEGGLLRLHKAEHGLNASFKVGTASVVAVCLGHGNGEDVPLVSCVGVPASSPAGTVAEPAAPVDTPFFAASLFVPRAPSPAPSGSVPLDPVISLVTGPPRPHVLVALGRCDVLLPPGLLGAAAAHAVALGRDWAGWRGAALAAQGSVAHEIAVEPEPATAHEPAPSPLPSPAAVGVAACVTAFPLLHVAAFPSLAVSTGPLQLSLLAPGELSSATVTPLAIRCSVGSVTVDGGETEGGSAQSNGYRLAAAVRDVAVWCGSNTASAQDSTSLHPLLHPVTLDATATLQTGVTLGVDGQPPALATRQALQLALSPSVEVCIDAERLICVSRAVAHISAVSAAATREQPVIEALELRHQITRAAVQPALPLPPPDALTAVTLTSTSSITAVLPAVTITLHAAGGSSGGAAHTGPGLAQVALAPSSVEATRHAAYALAVAGSSGTASEGSVMCCLRSLDIQGEGTASVGCLQVGLANPSAGGTPLLPLVACPPVSESATPLQPSLSVTWTSSLMPATKTASATVATSMNAAVAGQRVSLNPAVVAALAALGKAAAPAPGSATESPATAALVHQKSQQYRPMGVTLAPPHTSSSFTVAGGRAMLLTPSLATSVTLEAEAGAFELEVAAAGDKLFSLSAGPFSLAGELSADPIGGVSVATSSSRRHNTQLSPPLLRRCKLTATASPGLTVSLPSTASDGILSICGDAIVDVPGAALCLSHATFLVPSPLAGDAAVMLPLPSTTGLLTLTSGVVIAFDLDVHSVALQRLARALIATGASTTKRAKAQQRPLSHPASTISVTPAPLPWQPAPTPLSALRRLIVSQLPPPAEALQAPPAATPEALAATAASPTATPSIACCDRAMWMPLTPATSRDAAFAAFVYQAVTACGRAAAFASGQGSGGLLSRPLRLGLGQAPEPVLPPVKGAWWVSSLLSFPLAVAVAGVEGIERLLLGPFSFLAASAPVGAMGAATVAAAGSATTPPQLSCVLDVWVPPSGAAINVDAPWNEEEWTPVAGFMVATDTVEAGGAGSGSAHAAGTIVSGLTCFTDTAVITSRLWRLRWLEPGLTGSCAAAGLTPDRCTPQPATASKSTAFGAAAIQLTSSIAHPPYGAVSTALVGCIALRLSPLVPGSGEAAGRLVPSVPPLALAVSMPAPASFSLYHSCAKNHKARAGGCTPVLALSAVAPRYLLAARHCPGVGLTATLALEGIDVTTPDPVLGIDTALARIGGLVFSADNGSAGATVACRITSADVTLTPLQLPALAHLAAALGGAAKATSQTHLDCNVSNVLNYTGLPLLLKQAGTAYVTAVPAATEDDGAPPAAPLLWHYPLPQPLHHTSGWQSTGQSGAIEGCYSLQLAAATPSDEEAAAASWSRPVPVLATSPKGLQPWPSPGGVAVTWLQRHAVDSEGASVALQVPVWVLMCGGGGLTPLQTALLHLAGAGSAAVLPFLPQRVTVVLLSGLHVSTSLPALAACSPSLRFASSGALKPLARQPPAAAAAAGLATPDKSGGRRNSGRSSASNQLGDGLSSLDAASVVPPPALDDSPGRVSVFDGGVVTLSTALAQPSSTAAFAVAALPVPLLSALHPACEGRRRATSTGAFDEATTDEGGGAAAAVALEDVGESDGNAALRFLVASSNDSSEDEEEAQVVLNLPLESLFAGSEGLAAYCRSEQLQGTGVWLRQAVLPAVLLSSSSATLPSSSTVVVRVTQLFDPVALHVTGAAAPVFTALEVVPAAALTSAVPSSLALRWRNTKAAARQETAAVLPPAVAFPCACDDGTEGADPAPRQAAACLAPPFLPGVTSFSLHDGTDHTQPPSQCVVLPDSNTASPHAPSAGASPSSSGGGLGELEVGLEEANTLAALAALLSGGGGAAGHATPGSPDAVSSASMRVLAGPEGDIGGAAMQLSLAGTGGGKAAGGSGNSGRSGAQATPGPSSAVVPAFRVPLAAPDRSGAAAAPWHVAPVTGPLGIAFALARCVAAPRELAAPLVSFEVASPFCFTNATGMGLFVRAGRGGKASNPVFCPAGATQPLPLDVCCLKAVPGVGGSGSVRLLMCVSIATAVPASNSDSSTAEGAPDHPRLVPGRWSLPLLLDPTDTAPLAAAVPCTRQAPKATTASVPAVAATPSRFGPAVRPGPSTRGGSGGALLPPSSGQPDDATGFDDWVWPLVLQATKATDAGTASSPPAVTWALSPRLTLSSSAAAPAGWAAVPAVPAPQLPFGQGAVTAPCLSLSSASGQAPTAVVLAVPRDVWVSGAPPSASWTLVPVEEEASQRHWYGAQGGVSLPGSLSAAALVSHRASPLRRCLEDAPDATSTTSEAEAGALPPPSSSHPHEPLFALGGCDEERRLSKITTRFKLLTALLALPCIPRGFTLTAALPGAPPLALSVVQGGSDSAAAGTAHATVSLLIEPPVRVVNATRLPLALRLAQGPSLSRKATLGVHACFSGAARRLAVLRGALRAMEDDVRFVRSGCGTGALLAAAGRHGGAGGGYYPLRPLGTTASPGPSVPPSPSAPVYSISFPREILSIDEVETTLAQLKVALETAADGDEGSGRWEAAGAAAPTALSRVLGLPTPEPLQRDRPSAGGAASGAANKPAPATGATAGNAAAAAAVFGVAAPLRHPLWQCSYDATSPSLHVATLEPGAVTPCDWTAFIAGANLSNGTASSSVGLWLSYPALWDGEVAPTAAAGRAQQAPKHHAPPLGAIEAVDDFETGALAAFANAAAVPSAGLLGADHRHLYQPLQLGVMPAEDTGAMSGTIHFCNPVWLQPPVGVGGADGARVDSHASSSPTAAPGAAVSQAQLSLPDGTTALVTLTACLSGGCFTLTIANAHEGEEQGTLATASRASSSRFSLAIETASFSLLSAPAWRPTPATTPIVATAAAQAVPWWHRSIRPSRSPVPCNDPGLCAAPFVKELLVAGALGMTLRVSTGTAANGAALTRLGLTCARLQVEGSSKDPLVWLDPLEGGGGEAQDDSEGGASSAAPCVLAAALELLSPVPCTAMLSPSLSSPLPASGVGVALRLGRVHLTLADDSFDAVIAQCKGLGGVLTQATSVQQQVHGGHRRKAPTLPTSPSVALVSLDRLAVAPLQLVVTVCAGVATRAAAATRRDDANSAAPATTAAALAPSSASAPLHPHLPFFAGMDSVPITFAGITAASLHAPSWRLGREVLAHYIADTILAAPAIVGSLGVLGNPVGLARSIGASVADVVLAPLRHKQAAHGVHHPQQQHSSVLVSAVKVVGDAALNSLGGVSSAVARALEKAVAGVTAAATVTGGGTDVSVAPSVSRRGSASTSASAAAQAITAVASSCVWVAASSAPEGEEAGQLWFPPVPVAVGAAVSMTSQASSGSTSASTSSSWFGWLRGGGNGSVDDAPSAPPPPPPAPLAARIGRGMLVASMAPVIGSLDLVSSVSRAARQALGVSLQPQPLPRGRHLAALAAAPRLGGGAAATLYTEFTDAGADEAEQPCPVSVAGPLPGAELPLTPFPPRLLAAAPCVPVAATGAVGAACSALVTRALLRVYAPPSADASPFFTLTDARGLGLLSGPLPSSALHALEVVVTSENRGEPASEHVIEALASLGVQVSAHPPPPFDAAQALRHLPGCTGAALLSARVGPGTSSGGTWDTSPSLFVLLPIEAVARVVAALHGSA